MGFPTLEWEFGTVLVKHVMTYRYMAEEHVRILKAIGPPATEARRWGAFRVGPQRRADRRFGARRTYVPNPDGDQCIHAAPAGCFNAYAGLWRCEPTNNGNVWLINTNGYTYGANNNGQVGEGCTDCSGSFTTMSNGQGWVNVGTFTVRDGGTTAALDWNFCNGNTLQDLQTCTQSGTTYSQHSNCTLAAACPGQ